MKNVIVIGGPTASGKSGLAVALAEKLDGVVINADSLQVYRGLPILTAQPSDEDKARVPHALYETLSPRDVCSAVRWRGMALEEIEKAHAAGKTPIIAGGTGFYIKALLEGLSPIPEVAPEFRARGIALQQELGNPAFHEELKKRDPETALRLDPLNTQRNVRAWEVLEATGKGLAAWQSIPPEGPPAHLRFLTVALLPPREELFRRCDTRFGMMLEAGALDEVASFEGRQSALLHALGYQELSAHLRGEKTIEDATAAARQDTRNYAKRQTTWFRNQWEPDVLLEDTDAAPVMARL